MLLAELENKGSIEALLDSRLQGEVMYFTIDKVILQNVRQMGNGSSGSLFIVKKTNDISMKEEHFPPSHRFCC